MRTQLVAATRSAIRCPFCHGECSPSRDAWVACSLCLARHHVECWSEGKGLCASCGNKDVLTPRTRVSRALPVVERTWRDRAIEVARVVVTVAAWAGAASHGAVVWPYLLAAALTAVAFSRRARARSGRLLKAAAIATALGAIFDPGWLTTSPGAFVLGLASGVVVTDRDVAR